MSEKTYWFVEPEDAHTNGIIARSLLELSQLDENVSLTDVDGHSHSVFRVENYAFVNRLYKDQTKFLLKFKVFSQQGKNAKLRLWTLGIRKPTLKLKAKSKSKVKI
ncbi:MAG: hypothetical protein WCT50_01410 [Patescibacteria group bacterium]